MGHFFFKFKSGGLKTQRFSMFSATDPRPNPAAQKKLAFRGRKTPIHLPGQKRHEPPRRQTRAQQAHRHCLIKHTKFGPTRLCTSCRACPCNAPGPPQSSSMWPPHCAHPATMDPGDEPEASWVGLVPCHFWVIPASPCSGQDKRETAIYIYYREREREGGRERERVETNQYKN